MLRTVYTVRSVLRLKNTSTARVIILGDISPLPLGGDLSLFSVLASQRSAEQRLAIIIRNVALALVEYGAPKKGNGNDTTI